MPANVSASTQSSELHCDPLLDAGVKRFKYTDVPFCYVKY